MNKYKQSIIEFEKSSRIRALGLRKNFNFLAGGTNDDPCPGDECCECFQCSICFESITRSDLMRQIPCPGGHVFHSVCICKWLILNNNSTCPVCRFRLPLEYKQKLCENVKGEVEDMDFTDYVSDVNGKFTGMWDFTSNQPLEGLSLIHI